jgi:hypothetical protein
MKNRPLLAILAFLLFAAFVFEAGAEDFGFGFGDSEEEPAGSSAGISGTSSGAFPVSVKVGGKVKGELNAFFDDLNTFEEFKKSKPGDIFSGALNFSASGSNADGVISLDLKAGADPLSINEAYLRVFFGPANIEAGIRKLTWGKADSFGPLDVVNPLDYSDLSRITDVMAVKIARPMVHAAVGMGSGSKLEAVFLPGFEGHRFAAQGRWFPSAISPEIGSGVALADLSGYGGLIVMPKTDTLEYMQAGLRFTTTTGQADLGVQYFFGNLFRPSYSIEGIDAFLGDLLAVLPSNPRYTGNLSLIRPRVEYNRYHQLGADYARVIAGFNVRTELAAHITPDLAGEAGWVRNPFIGWSAGFDRDLVWGINVNLQCNETIRLFRDKNSNPLVDFEAGAPPTFTRLTLILSRKFLRDNLELKFTSIFDPEDHDLYLIPSLALTFGEAVADFSAGIFAGRDGGELSQYRNNGYIKTALTYTF